MAAHAVPNGKKKFCKNITRLLSAEQILTVERTAKCVLYTPLTLYISSSQLKGSKGSYVNLQIFHEI